MKDLKGRVAVVTGAASGIGRGLALEFAAEGMRLVLADVAADRLAAVAAEVRASGAPALAVPTDVSDPAAVERLAEATVEEYGAVHVLCNNAGVWTAASQWETSLDDWQWVIGVNLWGVIHGIRSFLPRLLAQPDGGHVVNVSSMGGLMGGPFIGPYIASKHAVVGISKSLRLELAMRGAKVGVTLVCPGDVNTGIIEALGTRPGHQRTAPAEQPPDVCALIDSIRDSFARTAISPGDVAKVIVQAIREDRFWLLPNAAPHMDLLQNEITEMLSAAALDSSASF
jgi:NAD(P)-dependent dehydrogenase (short-subunit alcohol dehydrogenase family)